MWTDPQPVAADTDASSSAFNAEVIDNLKHLYGRLKFGSFTVAFAGGSEITGSVVFDEPFAATPTAVLLTVQPITNNTTVAIGLTARSSTGFSWHAANVESHNVYTGNVTGFYLAIGEPI